MNSQTFSAETVEELRRRGGDTPSVALILGSGLGGFAAEIADARRIESKDIPGYPSSTVEGHAGSLVFGKIASDTTHSPQLVVFQGRVHYYESGSVETAVAPVRLAHALGARTLLVTNAAGGIDTSFHAGDLMLIDDVLALGPLRLPSRLTSQQFEPRPIFDRHLQQTLQAVAANLKIPLQKGTYVWVHGPSYETAAEIRMLRTYGAHAVGMSTVPEAFEARRLGMRVIGISLISNMGTGILPSKLSHEEVTITAHEASSKFTSLLRSFLQQLD